jgi:predicted GIY-YIG superfamily endonuclease
MARRTVYLIQSQRDASRHYVGVTGNLAHRIAAHNAGESPHTQKHRPWKLVVRIDFASEEKALALEKYLKSSSGSAFVSRYLL